MPWDRCQARCCMKARKGAALRGGKKKNDQHAHIHNKHNFLYIPSTETGHDDRLLVVRRKFHDGRLD